MTITAQGWLSLNIPSSKNFNIGRNFFVLYIARKIPVMHHRLELKREQLRQLHGLLQDYLREFQENVLTEPDEEDPIDWQVMDDPYDEECPCCSNWPYLGDMNVLQLIKNLEKVEYQVQKLEPRMDDICFPESQEQQLEEMEDCLENIRAHLKSKVSFFRYRNYGDWKFLDEVAETYPSVGLEEPEEYIAYRYAYGEFPRDMDYEDMVRVRDALKRQLEALEAAEDDCDDLSLLRFRYDSREEVLGEIILQIQFWEPEMEDWDFEWDEE